MILGSSPVAVTSPSDFAPASSKEFLDIQATIECGFTLKRVRDMTRTYSQTKPCLIYNLNITTALNRKLSGYISSLNPTKIVKVSSLQLSKFLSYLQIKLCLQINMETMFAYFYSKWKWITCELNINRMQILQNLMSSNEEQVTSNKQRAGSNN